MYITGVVLPKGSGYIKNLADEFTPYEVENIGLTGSPIWVQHRDRSTPEEKYDGVGRVVKDWVGEDGKKYIRAHIRGKTNEEVLTRERIKSGALKEFSLGHKFKITYDHQTGKMYQTKTPVEVSVCREGRRYKCVITQIELDEAEVDNPKRIKTSLYKSRHQASVDHKMATETTDSSIAPEAAPSFQAPSNLMGAPSSPKSASGSDDVVRQMVERMENLQKDYESLKSKHGELRESNQRLLDEEKQRRDADMENYAKELDALQEAFCRQHGMKYKGSMKEQVVAMSSGGHNLAPVQQMKEMLEIQVKAGKESEEKNRQYELKLAQQGQEIERWRQSTTDWQQTAVKKAMENAWGGPLASGRGKFEDVGARFESPPVPRTPAKRPFESFYEPLASPMEARAVSTEIPPLTGDRDRDARNMEDARPPPPSAQSTFPFKRHPYNQPAHVSPSLLAQYAESWKKSCSTEEVPITAHIHASVPVFTREEVDESKGWLQNMAGFRLNDRADKEGDAQARQQHVRGTLIMKGEQNIKEYQSRSRNW